MQNSYFTIKDRITSDLVEKKSKFIANFFYVQNEIEAEQKLEEVRKQERDARHNVFAYRLENGFEKYSDDGEPSGTAGVPILDILRGENLVNVLVIVTRYFGGILLGTGGLVRCYGGVVKQALESANRIEMFLSVEYKVVIDYDSYNSVLYYCNNNGIKVLNSNFLEKIEMNLLVRDSQKSIFLHDLSEITNRVGTIDEVRQYYHE